MLSAKRNGRARRTAEEDNGERANTLSPILLIRAEGTIKSKFDWEVAPIKLLALDQSTKITGWAAFEDNDLKRYGEIDLSKNTDPSGRFQDMCNAVQDLIHKEKPDFVVFEEVAMQVNAYALITLARLQGFILAVCFNRQIEHFIYPTGAWRKALGFKQGKGHARKDLKKQAIAYCKEHYGVDLDEDRADALCIGDAFTKTYLKEAN